MHGVGEGVGNIVYKLKFRFFTFVALTPAQTLSRREKACLSNCHSVLFDFFRPEQVAVAVLADGGDAPVDDRVVDEEVVHARPVLAAVDVFFFVGVDVYLAVEVFADGKHEQPFAVTVCGKRIAEFVAAVSVRTAERLADEVLDAGHVADEGEQVVPPHDVFQADVAEFVAEDEAQRVAVVVGERAFEDVGVDDAKGAVAGHAGGKGVERAVAVLYVEFGDGFQAEFFGHGYPFGVYFAELFGGDAHAVGTRLAVYFADGVGNHQQEAKRDERDEQRVQSVHHVEQFAVVRGDFLQYGSVVKFGCFRVVGAVFGNDVLLEEGDGVCFGKGEGKEDEPDAEGERGGEGKEWALVAVARFLDEFGVVLAHGGFSGWLMGGAV